MEKVKISKELAMATQKALESWGEEELLRSQSSGEKWTQDVFLPLNEISLIELAEILIKGYEVEKTPKENLLIIYKDSKENYPSEINFRNGIVTALSVLNIKIKGIND